MKKSKSKQKSRVFLQNSSSFLDENSIPSNNFVSSHSKLNILEQKVKQFQNLSIIQQQFLNDIANNNQKLDYIIAKIKNLMKLDTKGKKSNLSPFSKQNKNQKDKSSKRLIQRVEKAINEQSFLHNSK